MAVFGLGKWVAVPDFLPGFELAIFEKSGHLPQVEEEDAFVARLTAFLASPAGVR